MQSNFWAGSKNFGQAQNILGPVKGQGISVILGTLPGELVVVVAGVAEGMLLELFIELFDINPVEDCWFSCFFCFSSSSRIFLC